MDFGAVGDGVTDDTAAIQATYDYAASVQSAIIAVENPPTNGYLASGSKPTVHFPSGKYKLTTTVGAGGNINTTGDRAYVFSETLTYPLFTVSAINTEWSGLIFDGGTYHLLFGSTTRTEASVTHVHDCEFRIAYEYCIGDDISVHYNYPMIVRIDNCKSYGSSFAYLHNNGTFISDCWVGWDVSAQDTADNPLFDCSDPFVLRNITEVPFDGDGTGNTNRTPRIYNSDAAGIHGSRALALTCENVRFGGEATATPILQTNTAADQSCTVEFNNCAMFGVADYYWAEFNGEPPRRLVVRNMEGRDSSQAAGLGLGMSSSLGMRVATTFDPLDSQFGHFFEFSKDVPTFSQRLIVTDTRTGTSIPAGANPANYILNTTTEVDSGKTLINYDTGNGFTLDSLPYEHSGSAVFNSTVAYGGFSYRAYAFDDPNENYSFTIPSLAPAGGAGIYTVSIDVIPTDGVCTWSGGYRKDTATTYVSSGTGNCDLGFNQILWKFWYNGTDPIDVNINISAIANSTRTTIALGRVFINKGNIVGAFTPVNTTTTEQHSKIAFGNAAPVDGKWTQGAIVYDAAPNAGSTIGWVCTVAGTPGTWKTFGAISA